MSFNELNSVEHYIIHQLSCVNLNANSLAEKKSSYGNQWIYKSSQKLQRGVNEVLVRSKRSLNQIKSRNSKA